MSKNTIFGEENFIIKGMVAEINNKLDNVIIDNLTNTIKYTLPGIQINHEKVRRWVMLCSRLENIEETELIDMATKKKIADLKDKLKQQLDEKDKEIKKLNWQLKDKDFIIKNLNHSLSVAPNANAGQRARIDELTKIVKEKDKEIERLNKYNKELYQSALFTNNMEFIDGKQFSDMAKKDYMKNKH